MHYDWLTKPLIDSKTGLLYNRAASFFLYFATDCTSGATYFPHISPPPDTFNESERYTTTVNRSGLAVLPRLGSGVFWLNLHPNRTGDTQLIHAGLPVTSGTKVGLNIWFKDTISI
ncbi:hypothetical protein F5Y10DRAFT_273659 [Nemania abortiva]|nr:hypothetical protein F5Y10DRAFT_273659 [Nemania abortiva]